MKDVTAVVSSPLQTEEPKAANHVQVRDQTLLKVDQQWINATQPQETSVKPYHWPQEKNKSLTLKLLMSCLPQRRLTSKMCLFALFKSFSGNRTCETLIF